MARPTVARIDLDALAHNVAAVRRLIGRRTLCGVVKADAYGHGAAVVARAMELAGVDMFAVALTEEALELRAAGVHGPIVLLAPVPAEDVGVLLDERVAACVAEQSFAQELASAALARGVRAPVHVKIDTGMHRAGFDWETAARAVLRIRDLAGIRIAGIFTHFARADDDDLRFSREQARRFRTVLGQLRRAGIDPPLAHVANSSGVLRVPEAYLDGVRPGLILYGLHPRPDGTPEADLRPILRLQTRIAHCKSVRRGETIGYGHTFATWRESRIAVLPIGYHDGYVRQFSNAGEVLVRGARAPVVGRVCMDQTLIDVTDVPGVHAGDEVVVYGSQGGASVGIEAMAERIGGIPYELTCAISPRVRRQFVLGGAVVVETPQRSAVPGAMLDRLFASAPASWHGPSRSEPAQRGAA